LPEAFRGVDRAGKTGILRPETCRCISIAAWLGTFRHEIQYVHFRDGGRHTGDGGQ